MLGSFAWFFLWFLLFLNNGFGLWGNLLFNNGFVDSFLLFDNWLWLGCSSHKHWLWYRDRGGDLQQIKNPQHKVINATRASFIFAHLELDIILQFVHFIY
jgi:hypothetical protein